MANIMGGASVKSGNLRKSVLTGGQTSAQGQEEQLPKRFYEDSAGNKKQDKD